MQMALLGAKISKPTRCQSENNVVECKVTSLNWECSGFGGMFGKTKKFESESRALTCENLGPLAGKTMTALVASPKRSARRY